MRRTTLHFMQTGLTDARTFMKLLVTEGDATFLKVIGRYLNRYSIPGKDPDEVFTHLARNVAE